MFRNILHTSRIIAVAPLLKAESLVEQQTRNAFVLKRRWKPPLHGKNLRPKILKSRYFVYDLVEDTNMKRKPDIQVILTAFVDGLGNKGDLVSVRPLYAYNKLLLPGLAVYDTPENQLKYKKTETSTVTNEKVYSSRFAKRTIDILERRIFAIVMNKKQPWTVEPWHIRVSLRKAGINILDDSAIELPKVPIHGPDPAKQNKEFAVTITVNNTEKARVRCRIHHWGNDPKTIEPYVFEHYKHPAEPLFPDDPDQVIPFVAPDAKQPEIRK